MAIINPKSGVTGSEVVLTLVDPDVVGDLVVSNMTDISVSMANETFTLSTLDSVAKHQYATTATNSISGNFAMDDVDFNGDTGALADSAPFQGIETLAKNQVRVEFTINIGTYLYAGAGQITGLNPAVSADGAVFQSPITIAVDGAYTKTLIV